MVFFGTFACMKAFMGNDQVHGPSKNVPHAAPSLPSEAVQTSVHVVHPKVVPDRLSWKDRETYTGSELSYRNREPKHPITLAGRQLRVFAA